MYPPESHEDLQQAANQALFSHTGLSPIERDARKNTVGCLLVVAVVIALVAFWFLGNQINQQIRFSREGVTTVGRVDSIYRGRRSSSMVYRFEVDSIKYAGSDSTSRITTPGDAVPIEYLASDPAISRRVGYTGHYVVYTTCALFLFVSFVQIVACIRESRVLNQPEEIVPLGSTEDTDAPAWATQPYQNAMRAKCPPTDPKSDLSPVMDEPLKPLITDREHR